MDAYSYIKMDSDSAIQPHEAKEFSKSECRPKLTWNRV